MADNEQLSDGLGGTITVSMDEAASGQVQRMKLAYSADGSDTHVQADASGLLVNLGAANDVVLTSGTLTAVSGTVTTSVAGTPTVSVPGDVTIGAGTAVVGYVGHSNDGTAIVDVLSLTSGTASAVGIYDTDGTQVALPAMRRVEATPTLGTGVCAQYDCLHSTIITLSQVALTNGGTGHIVGATLTNRLGTFAGIIKAYLFDTSVTVTAAQDQLSVSDSDMETGLGTLEFDFSASNASASRVANASRTDLPIPFKCAAGVDDIFVILQLWSNLTPTFAASDLKLRVMVQPDS